jgi:uncharacterized membrane protein
MFSRNLRRRGSPQNSPAGTKDLPVRVAIVAASRDLSFLHATMVVLRGTALVVVYNFLFNHPFASLLQESFH